MLYKILFKNKYVQSVSKSKIHHMLNYVVRKKEIPRISHFFGLAQPPAKI
jgi:hypothetical protein